MLSVDVYGLVGVATTSPPSLDRVGLRSTAFVDPEGLEGAAGLASRWSVWLVRLPCVGCLVLVVDGFGTDFVLGMVDGFDSN